MLLSIMARRARRFLSGGRWIGRLHTPEGVEDCFKQFQMFVAADQQAAGRVVNLIAFADIDQTERAQALFQEIVKSVRGAPGYYRSRQREWYKIAKEQLGA